MLDQVKTAPSCPASRRIATSGTTRLYLAALSIVLATAGAALIWLACLENAVVAFSGEHDAGMQRAGTAVNHQFVLRNNSLNKATITGVAVACSCDTEAKAGAAEIAWLGQTDVAVRWVVPRKEGPAETQVVVSYVDGYGPGKVTLRMHCRVGEQ